MRNGFVSRRLNATSNSLSWMYRLFFHAQILPRTQYQPPTSLKTSAFLCAFFPAQQYRHPTVYFPSPACFCFSINDNCFFSATGNTGHHYRVRRKRYRSSGLRSGGISLPPSSPTQIKNGPKYLLRTVLFLNVLSRQQKSE
jgi:hypothetical protein